MSAVEPGVGAKVGSGLAGGLCGGSLVGVVEALWVLMSTRPSEYQALLFGDVGYGLLGAVLGGVAAVPLALSGFSRASVWAVCAAGVAAGLGSTVALDVAGRVAWSEHGVPGTAAAAIVGGFVAAALVAAWIGRLLLVKTPLRVVTAPRGTAVLWGGGSVLVALFATTPAPGGEGTPTPGRAQGGDFARKPDVVLVVVEGLRADAWAEMPRLRALAGEGVVFEQHVVAATWPRASMGSLLSSLSPGAHGADVRESVLPEGAATLAEAMRAGGYVTGGLPSDARVSGTFGFDQGFDWYPFPVRSPLGATLSSTLLTLYGPMRALAAPAPARVFPAADAQVAEARRFVEAQGADRFFLLVELAEPCAALADPTGSDPPRLRARYVEGLHAADAALGALLDALRAAGRYDGAVIAVTGDHGVELGEHGGWGETATLYEEALHVPLVVRLPGGERAGTRVPWQVRQVDVAPTLLDLAGLPADPGWEGTALLDDAFDAALALATPPPGLGPDDPPWRPPGWADLPASRDAVAEQDVGGYALQAIRADGHALVRAARVPTSGSRMAAGYACFDLVADPTEAAPLPADQCDASLAARLDAMVQEHATRRVSDVEAPDDAADGTAETQAERPP